MVSTRRLRLCVRVSVCEGEGREKEGAEIEGGKNSTPPHARHHTTGLRVLCVCGNGKATRSINGFVLYL